MVDNRGNPSERIPSKIPWRLKTTLQHSSNKGRGKLFTKAENIVWENIKEMALLEFELNQSDLFRAWTQRINLIFNFRLTNEKIIYANKTVLKFI